MAIIAIKLGVFGFEKLIRPVRRKLKPLFELYASHGKDFIITSIAEGTHLPSSLHYAYSACDFKWDGMELQKIKDILGNDFDVYVNKELNFIHIEFDPK